MGSKKSKTITIKKPWGLEEHVLIKDLFGVKRIVLKKGKCSSFHFHKKKSEVFYIKKGTVRMRFKKSSRTYKKGQYLYLPKKVLHQIINVGNGTLEIIEFSYPYSVKDVVRVEDPWSKVRRTLRQ